MRVPVIALAAAMGLALGVGACADEYAYGPYGPYADVGYTAYYDGYYGPYVGGYWAGDGSFYYWDGAHQRYDRDRSRHFRRHADSGFSPIQGHAPPARQGSRRSGGRQPHQP
ncbi:MAG TPA: hypothetical protein VGS12_16945 [Caulobacteraceae bacterium]|nr:hypothetical protein [Caulobacteraceae bacterium]